VLCQKYALSVALRCVQNTSGFVGLWPSPGVGVNIASGGLGRVSFGSRSHPPLFICSPDWLTLWKVGVSLHVLSDALEHRAGCPPSLTSHYPSVEGNCIWGRTHFTFLSVSPYGGRESASLHLLSVVLEARAGRLSTLGLTQWVLGTVCDRRTQRSYFSDDADRALWGSGDVYMDGPPPPLSAALEGVLGQTAPPCCQKGQDICECPPDGDARPRTLTPSQ